MSSGNFTFIRSVMRPLLGDNDADAGYDSSDAMLDDSIRAAFIVNDIEGVELTGDREDIMPAPTVRQVGIIALEACWLMMAGDQGQYSYRTRALAEADSGQRKRDIMLYARERLRVLKDGDAIFASTQSLAAFLNASTLAAMIQVNPSAPPALALNFAGVVASGL